MLDFSLSITAVVSTAASAFVLWDCMKTSLSALTARKCDSGPMESCTSILIISLSYLSYKLCMSANSVHTKKMRYQANHVHEPGAIKDVFDGSHYQSLLNTIVPGGEDNPFFYFSDECNIALGLSTDGFAPFKKCDKTCWPVILFNYNLPLKYVSRRNIAFTLPWSQAPKSLGIGTHFIDHLFRN